MFTKNNSLCVIFVKVMSVKEKFNDRYLSPDDLNSFLKGLDKLNSLSILGYSEQNRPIYAVNIGHGPIKILLWSQQLNILYIIYIHLTVYYYFNSLLFLFSLIF